MGFDCWKFENTDSKLAMISGRKGLGISNLGMGKEGELGVVGELNQQRAAAGFVGLCRAHENVLQEILLEVRKI